MKKFTIIFILIAFIFSQGMVFAFSELHYLKNTNSYVVKSLVEEVLKDKNYQIIKSSPYFAKSIKNPENYVGIVIQQSGENLFYYYESNKDKATNKKIKKAIKKLEIVSEQSQNEMHLTNFAKRIQDANNPTQNQYTVADLNKPSSKKDVLSSVNKSKDSTSGKIETIQKNTIMKAYFQSGVNTSTAQKDESITAILSEDFIYDGYVVAPQGSVVSGFVSKARPAQLGSRNGRVVIDFNKITTPEGKVYDVILDEIDFKVTNEGKFQKVVKNSVIAGAVGALFGLVYGVCTGDIGSAVAIGAAIGAGGAAGAAVVERGVDAEIPAFTELELTFKEHLKVVLY